MRENPAAPIEVVFVGSSEWKGDVFAGKRLPVDQPRCHTYWGSHGCDLPEGHDGHHFCNGCDCVNHPDMDPEVGYPTCVCAYPYYGPDTNFYH